MRRLSLLLVAVLLVAPAPFARASSTFYPKILLHLMSPTSKNACGRAGAAPTCANIVTRGDLAPAGYFAYVLVTDGDPSIGLAGVEFGVEYDGRIASGVDILAWNVCGDMHFPSSEWPASGTGSIVTWSFQSHCQLSEPGGPGTGVTAVAGYFYVSAYSPDELRIIPRPISGRAAVADCSAREILVAGPGATPVPWPLGRAAFSAGAAVSGDNPCGQATTGAPECAIIGPDAVPPFGTATFEATSSLPGASFDWTISGQGSIVGPSNMNTVTVTAGGPGQFAILVTVSVPTGTSECREVVSVVETPHCGVYGPDQVSAGPDTVTCFASVTALPPVTLEWSVSGSGVLLGSSGDRVFVQATSPGSLAVHLQVTDGNGSISTCDKSILVGAGGCSITGPETAFAERVLWYGPGVSASSYDWSISGNGEITARSPDGGINVVPGAPGFFTLHLTVSGGAGSSACEKMVAVLPLPQQPPGSQESAKLMIHLAPSSSPNACQAAGAHPRCADIRSRGDLFPATYFAYLVLGDGNASAGIAGFQCGIQYDARPQSGVDLFDWRACCDQPIIGSGWPASGSGAWLNWDYDNCQRTEPGGAGTGVIATAGYFYLAAYSPDTFRLTTYPVDRVFSVVDCNFQDSAVEGQGHHPTPYPLGYARFSAGAVEPGSVPCAADVPVMRTTWGAIKSIFGKG